MIETQCLSKKYDDLLAVQNMSITVEEGEIYGFIGLNGAGKTTAIRMLLGMIRPTEGLSYIKGEKVHRKNYHLWKHVGYIVETPHSYPELTVQENLDLYRRLRSISNQHTVSEVMNLLHLTRYSHVKAKHLSLGNAQRLGIAKSLINSPDILILDDRINRRNAPFLSRTVCSRKSGLVSAINVYFKSTYCLRSDEFTPFNSIFPCES